MTDHSDWEQKLLKIATLFQQDIPFDFLATGFNNMGEYPFTECGFLRIGFNEYQCIGTKELLTITGLTMDELMKLHIAYEKATAAHYFNEEAFENNTRKPSLKKIFKETFQLKSQLVLPLQLSNGKQFSFAFIAGIRKHIVPNILIY
jgi:hypothetical protein